MSTATVAGVDFRSIRRSYAVVGVVVAFAALAGLVFLGSSEVHPHPVRTTFGLSALVAWALPLLLAPLAYLAIAGDRARGTITYHLGLPNSRASYFRGKYVTRAGVAAVTTALGVAVAFAVALATYEHAPDPGRFLALGALSTAFALAMVGVFVAVSASVAARSRAMVGVIGAYFVLSAFWVGPLPLLNLGTALDAVAALPGVALPDSTRALIGSLSPAGAYFNLLPELVWARAPGEYAALQQFAGRPDYLGYEPWFNGLVLAAWTVGAPLVGYLRFRSAELG
ncbi:copper ABC transporter permease [Halosimplex carlsbadense 2-9-1]|uniref:Copper ABC transporter permease n=1 Tax=Halosimplex carlsbadense 2-9-1 TaxID=797114 RepID=M0CR59_9EURY|nr:ABC transporter permease subunit [Halosimplex carlsbadense]ELZ25711.1 copper ABC transporter permease [Halosimplex carlsbadense 2-9-1]